MRKLPKWADGMEMKCNNDTPDCGWRGPRKDCKDWDGFDPVCPKCEQVCVPVHPDPVVTT